MTPASRIALRARVWRRAFDAGAVADLLRETTNEHARRDSGAWLSDDEELAGLAADLDALLARAQRYLDQRGRVAMRGVSVVPTERNDPAAMPLARGQTGPHAPKEGAIR